MSKAMTEPATPPAAWVSRFAGLIPHNDDPVLDLACGGGRHTLLLHGQGYRVLAVDRDLTAARAPAMPLEAGPAPEWIEADLEASDPFAAGGVLHDRRWAGIVAVNYLHRPLLPGLIRSLRPGGVLIYETFAEGNAAFGRPRNPAYLLKAGELLEAVRGQMTVIAYEHGRVDQPEPAIKQRLCAIKSGPIKSGAIKNGAVQE